MIKKYMKKPVTISAIQWDGTNTKEVYDFLGNSTSLRYEENRTYNKICIHTLEGSIEASIGDYIIRGIKGEHYPCKPEIFELTYEEIV